MLVKKPVSVALIIGSVIGKPYIDCLFWISVQIGTMIKTADADVWKVLAWVYQKCNRIFLHWNAVIVV